MISNYGIYEENLRGLRDIEWWEGYFIDSLGVGDYRYGSWLLWIKVY